MEFRRVLALRGPNIWGSRTALEVWIDLNGTGEGVEMADLLGRVALELQELAGSPVGFSRASATSEPGVVRVAVEYEEEDLGRAALESARTFDRRRVPRERVPTWDVLARQLAGGAAPRQQAG